jgi:hypothetical protein
MANAAHAAEKRGAFQVVALLDRRAVALPTPGGTVSTPARQVRGQLDHVLHELFLAVSYQPRLLVFEFS